VIIWRNDEFVDGDAAISVEDRGWLIGDAAFETIFIRRGAPAFLGQHLARLAHGLATLGIRLSLDASQMRRVIEQLAEKNGLRGDAACRLTVSRVGGPRGLAPSSEARPQLVISAVAAGRPPSDIRVMISDRLRWTGASTNSFKCAGAYAENFLARADAVNAGADDAIMLNEHGRVASASAANVFVLTGEGLRTPPVSEGALPGVVRGILLEEAGRLGMAAQEAAIDPSALSSSFLLFTNSIIGVVRAALEGARPPDCEEAARRLIDAYGRRLAQDIGEQHLNGELD
jgi:branched-chain amino acid aminotransferase